MSAFASAPGTSADMAGARLDSEPGRACGGPLLGLRLVGCQCGPIQQLLPRRDCAWHERGERGASPGTRAHGSTRTWPRGFGSSGPLRLCAPSRGRPIIPGLDSPRG